MARQFGVDVRVDRLQLAESLATLRCSGDIGAAAAEAGGSDKRTKFRMQLFGRCEGKLVALCAMTIVPGRLPLLSIEEQATVMVVHHNDKVLGVQATHGAGAGVLEGISGEKPLIRLLPVNVFNRGFFKSKLALIERDKKIKLLDAGVAAVIQLVKPWLFYDVPPSKRRLATPQNLLPF